MDIYKFYTFNQTLDLLKDLNATCVLLARDVPSLRIETLIYASVSKLMLCRVKAGIDACALSFSARPSISTRPIDQIFLRTVLDLRKINLIFSETFHIVKNVDEEIASV